MVDLEKVQEAKSNNKDFAKQYQYHDQQDKC